MARGVFGLFWTRHATGIEASVPKLRPVRKWLVVVIMVVLFPAIQLAGYGSLVTKVWANDPKTQAEAVQGNTTFAIDMYKKISAGNTKKNNIFFSPFSISTVLAMTYAGSRENTADQIARVLHFTLSPDNLNSAFGKLLTTLNGRGARGYQLSIANSLWGQKDYSFSEGFLALMGKYYDGGFNTVDFKNATEKSRKTINQWVEQKTADKIEELLEPGDVNTMTRLVLTNAVYFKGDWAEPFKQEQTKPMPFFLSEKEISNVPMMRQQGEFRCAETDDVKVLELPYAGKDVVMVVLLPQTKDGIDRLRADLTPQRLTSYLAALSARDAEIYLPKFKFSARYELQSIMADMGMTDAFSTNADFSGMTGRKDLHISAVIHQAVIDVNETGSEAAAATAVVIRAGVSRYPKQPFVFLVDHPFMFMIIHKPSNSILFVGQVANPVQE